MKWPARGSVPLLAISTVALTSVCVGQVLTVIVKGTMTRARATDSHAHAATLDGVVVATQARSNLDFIANVSPVS